MSATLLSASGTFHAGACPFMMVPVPVLLLFSGFCCLMYSLSMWSVAAIFLMYSLMFVVSFWIVVLTLTSPAPPSFDLAYSLRVPDLGWNPPCIMRSFLDLSASVLMPLASISSLFYIFFFPFNLFAKSPLNSWWQLFGPVEFLYSSR